MGLSIKLLEELQNKEAVSKFSSTLSGKNLPLSSLSDKELNYQISHCIKEISEQLDINVKHFSYPEGQEHHFNSEVIAVLKKENIICSPSAIYGYNDFSEDLFHLKRIMVGFDGAVFPHDGFI